MEVHLSKLREMAKAREGWRAAVHGVTGSDTTEQPNNNKKQEPRWWQRDPRREEQKAQWVLAAERRGVRLGQGDWRASGRSMPPFLGGRGPWSQAKDESQPRGPCPTSLQRNTAPSAPWFTWGSGLCPSRDSSR